MPKKEMCSIGKVRYDGYWSVGRCGLIRRQIGEKQSLAQLFKTRTSDTISSLSATSNKSPLRRDMMNETTQCLFAEPHWNVLPMAFYDTASVEPVQADHDRLLISRYLVQVELCPVRASAHWLQDAVLKIGNDA